MPPKMVVCCKCNKEVTKRSTLETAPGKRACRTHGSTKSMARKKQNFDKQTEQIKVAKKKKAQRNKRIRMGTGTREEMGMPSKFQNEYGDVIGVCHRCGTEGVRSDIFALRALEDMQESKLQLNNVTQTGLNFHTPDFEKKVGGVSLFVLSIEKYPEVDTISLKPCNIQFKEMTNCVLLCMSCLTVCKMDHLVKPNLNKMSIQKLGLLGAIGGDFAMENVLKKHLLKVNIDLQDIDSHFNKLEAARTVADYWSTNNIPNEACFKSDEIHPGVWLMKCVKANYIVSSKGVIQT